MDRAKIAVFIALIDQVHRESEDLPAGHYHGAW